MQDGFIARHGLWTDDQQSAAELALARIRDADIRLIRLVWCDTHGWTRARTVTPAAFRAALTDGYSIGAGSWSLDAAGGRVFQTFTKGGGMGLPEMTGSPNLILVPAPETFRPLPWAPGVAMVLCDDYFRDGRPFFFSPRHLLRRILKKATDKGYAPVLGLEVEWTLMRRLDGDGEEPVNLPGRRGAPPATTPVEPGFSYDSETYLDRVQPLISSLADHYSALDLGLRSFDNELGAGQLECTFDPKPAWDAAADFLIFRSATRQITRREGYLASFMTFPDGPGLFPSGWHLHLSLTDAETGRNLFTPDDSAALSPTGLSFLAGQLEHARTGIAFSAPTVNGYRRFRANSLAPDRVAWNVEHRGVMLRVLGGAGSPATRIENRVGEPTANPYLAMAAQIAAGLDGIARGLKPFPPDDEPYQSDRDLLPTSLPDALDLLEGSDFYRDAFGDTYLTYFLRMKRAEIARYQAFLSETGTDPNAGVTDWETNEYFDAF